jgi:hypothetical protein
MKDERTLRELQERVTARAREFDLVALVRLLRAHGYGPGQIRYESHRKLGSARSLVERVHFSSDGEVAQRTAVAPSDRVTITVQLGLLGGQGLLPSYFDDVLRESHEPQRMLAFLRFFDHRLIESYLRHVMPEDDKTLFADLAALRSTLRSLLHLRSISSMQWLFQQVFPELGVHVTRRGLPVQNEGFGAQTGRSKLDGGSVLGPRYEAESAGLAVCLSAVHEHHDHGERWHDLARERLQTRILPYLAPLAVPLLVELALPHRAAALVEPELYEWDQDPTQLGYERLLGQVPGARWPARDHATCVRIREWEGKVGTHHKVELFRGNTCSYGDTFRSAKMRA